MTKKKATSVQGVKPAKAKQGKAKELPIAQDMEAAVKLLKKCVASKMSRDKTMTEFKKAGFGWDSLVADSDEFKDLALKLRNR